jgi:hypothetical protein
LRVIEAVSREHQAYGHHGHENRPMHDLDGTVVKIIGRARDDSTQDAAENPIYDEREKNEPDDNEKCLQKRVWLHEVESFAADSKYFIHHVEV